MTTLFATHADSFAIPQQGNKMKSGGKTCFVEGKITQSWGMFPLGHYQEQHSRQMADKWMLGLVTNYWS
jgi:hypothetical protein